MKETRTIEWDTSSGRCPKKGERIRNVFGWYKVIDRKGNTITITEDN